MSRSDSRYRAAGVDSSVVAILLHKAIGDKLTCMFIDHGLLRKGEAEGEVDNVNRIVYDVTSKPQATIEWE